MAKKKTTKKRSQKVETYKPENIHETISWKALEFFHQKRGVLWYIVSSTIAFALLYYALKNRDWVILTMVVASYTAIYAHYMLKPRLLDYEVSSLGVKIGEKFYPHADIRSFSIKYLEDQNILYLEFMRGIKPPVSIELENVDVEKLYAMLQDHVLEDPDAGSDFMTIVTKLLKL